jgi:hypothetical protein
MDVSSIGSAMSGLAGAQTMFAVAAQTAGAVTDANSGSGGSAGEAVQIAMLQKTLEMERSMVNILA